MSAPVVRRFYEREAVQKDPERDKTRVLQQFKEEVDVNRIVQKAMGQGVWPPRPGAPGQGPVPQYGDFSQVGDFQDAFARVELMEELFYNLPAEVRDLAKNDMGVFNTMLEDPAFQVKVSEVLGETFGPEPAPPQPPPEPPPAPPEPPPTPPEPPE